MRMRKAIVVALLVLAGCAAEERAGDASARQACIHFANVRQDIVDGVLTPAETRAKLQEVEDSAVGSEVPGIAEGAREMLGGLTQNDTDRMRSGIETFDAACDTVDF